MFLLDLCNFPVLLVLIIILVSLVSLAFLSLFLLCHVVQLKGFEDRQFSPWRDRPIEESLRLFDDMRYVIAVAVFAAQAANT